MVAPHSLKSLAKRDYATVSFRQHDMSVLKHLIQDSLAFKSLLRGAKICFFFFWHSYMFLVEEELCFSVTWGT